MAGRAYPLGDIPADIVTKVKFDVSMLIRCSCGLLDLHAAEFSLAYMYAYCIFQVFQCVTCLHTIDYDEGYITYKRADIII